MKVYLAGPIADCTDEECKGWRERAKKLLKGCHCLDPVERDFRGDEPGKEHEIVDGDLSDIRKSDVVLVSATPRTKGASWGTPMEVVYAKVKMGKRVVAFGAGPRPSPWLTYHAEVFGTLEDACAALTKRRAKT